MSHIREQEECNCLTDPTFNIQYKHPKFYWNGNVTNKGVAKLRNERVFWKPIYLMKNLEEINNAT